MTTTPTSVTDGGGPNEWANPQKATLRDSDFANNVNPSSTARLWSAELIIDGVSAADQDEAMPIALPAYPALDDVVLHFTGLAITGAELKLATSGVDVYAGGNLVETNALQARDYSAISVPDANIVSAVEITIQASQTGTNAIVGVIEITGVTHAAPQSCQDFLADIRDQINTFLGE